MFDGHFDPAFHEAFLARDEDDAPIATPAWLAALTIAASVGLLGAVWAVIAA